MIRMRSPRHTLSPAVSASWWPWLRISRTATMRGSFAAASVMTSQVRSREPSSTSTISARAADAVQHRAATAQELRQHALLVEAGATTDRAGRNRLSLGSLITIG